MRLPKPKYRIVPDTFAGYEVQVRRWWFPFWVQPRTNTHHTVDKAKEYIDKHCHRFVEYYQPKEDTP